VLSTIGTLFFGIVLPATNRLSNRATIAAEQGAAEPEAAMTTSVPTDRSLIHDETSMTDVR
jgi:hypothetical protein